MSTRYKTYVTTLSWLDYITLEYYEQCSALLQVFIIIVHTTYVIYCCLYFQLRFGNYY